MTARAMTRGMLGDPVDTDDLASTVRDLGVLALDFGLIRRATFHPDGVTPETDSTHTVMLGLLACALAERIGGLDVGRVAQLALVHDLPEVYADDTSTIRLPTVEEQAAKRKRERDAFGRIAGYFGRVLPWLPLTISSYEMKVCREADFVWGVDKICPKVTHIANGGVTPPRAGHDRDRPGGAVRAPAAGAGAPVRGVAGADRRLRPARGRGAGGAGSWMSGSASAAVSCTWRAAGGAGSAGPAAPARTTVRRTEVEKLTRKRFQPGPQPPPTYTSHGTIPDGYVTWNSSRREIGDAAVRERGLCYPILREQAGMIRFGRLIDRKVVRGFVNAAGCN